MIETVSPHRIQHNVCSAQFRIHPAEVAARLAPGRDYLQALDFEFVHRLGTISIVYSVTDPKTGKMIWGLPATILDSMRLAMTIFAPFPEAYDVTVIG